jgi:predicted ester cyclase
MTRPEILSFFSARDAGWRSKNPDDLSRGHAEDGTVVSPMFGTLRGRNAIGDAYRSLFTVFPDWDMVTEDPLIDGMRVAQPFSVTATHVGEFMGLAGTNRRFQIQGVRLFDMGDGLIQHERRLYDFTGLLIQVGVLRGKPAK